MSDWGEARAQEGEREAVVAPSSPQDMTWGTPGGLAGTGLECQVESDLAWGRGGERGGKTYIGNQCFLFKIINGKERLANWQVFFLSLSSSYTSSPPSVEHLSCYI